MTLAPRPTSYPLASGERNPQQIVNAVRSLQAGQVNYTGTATLTGTQTNISSPIAGKGQLPFPFPQNAAAAAAWAALQIWGPPIATPGVIVFNHTAAPPGCLISWQVLG